MLRWQLVAITGLLSPFAAIAIKPSGYSFYMFSPAITTNFIDRARLLGANALLLLGLAVSVTAALVLVREGIRQRNLWQLFWLVVILLHPLQQPVFLEKLNARLNYLWYDHVSKLGVIGKREQEVATLLGAPSHKHSTSYPSGERYTIWKYKLIPIYWLGSTCEVVFVAGRACNVEPNAD